MVSVNGSVLDVSRSAGTLKQDTWWKRLALQPQLLINAPISCVGNRQASMDVEAIMILIIICIVDQQQIASID